MKIIVAGEVCVDEYIHGTSSRMSPEDPSVPVVKVEKTEFRDGMSSNVFNNLKAIGVDAVLISNSKEPGIVKTRVFSNSKQIARIDFDDVEKEKTDEACLEEMKQAVTEADALIVQDYGKGFWNETTLAIIPYTTALGKPVFVDPYPTTPISSYAGCTLLTPNVDEASRLTGKTDLFEMHETILKETNAKYSIITMAKDGMSFMKNGNPALHQLFPDPVQPVDACGAGDTVISVIAYLFTLGYSIEHCIKIGNAAAGKVIQKVGNAQISKEELECMLSKYK